MRLVFTVLLFARIAQADEVGDWARERLKEQKAGLGAAEKPLEPEAVWRERTIIPFWKERLPGMSGVGSSFVPPSSLAPLVRSVRAAVVNIAARNGGASKGLGSGFVITSDGLVVTNSHVVERAEAIVVRLADGRSLGAKVVGHDAEIDLALLRLEGAADLPVVTLGDSDALEVGDWVVAIGNPFGLDTSVTHGLISARERVIGVGPFDDFIQIDALINPGNSGGPLFDMRGHVVGVTSAIMNEGQGIGFAVPVNLVKDLLPNLRDNGTPVRGWLGVTISEGKDTATQEAMVVDVHPDSPAARAGLVVGDRLLSVNGKRVERYQQLLRRIAVQGPGVVVRLGVLRGNKRLEVQALLSVRPSQTSSRAMAAGARIDALGLVLEEVEPKDGTGVRVEAVAPGSVSELAGLAAHDVIVELNRTQVTSIRQLQALVSNEKSDELLIKFTRGPSSRLVTLKRRIPGAR